MNTLFFDTETTGKLRNDLLPQDPRQPRVVQLAAILAGDNRRIRGQMSLLIKPDGWEIPPDASRVHGLTNAVCQNHGVDIASALSIFADLCAQATTVVAHNIDFDLGMMCGEYHRRQLPNATLPLNPYCTMKSSMYLVNLPGRYGSPKWPSLNETHRHFFGTDVDGAHDALADVTACMNCYWRLNPLPVPEHLLAIAQ